MAYLSVTRGPQNIRASAVLTNAAVNSASVPLPQTANQHVALYITFTLGSLTNVVINPQVSLDGTTWFDMISPGTQTLTASGTKHLPCACAGAKLFRVQATGTGTVTGSLLQLDVGTVTQLVTN